MKFTTTLKRAGLAAVIAGVLGTGVAETQAITWSGNSGNWTATGSWSGGVVPNGIDQVASFTNNISAATAVSMNLSPIVGAINFGDSNASHTFTVAATGANFLTLESAGTTVTIGKTLTTSTVVDTISAPITLNDNLVITNAATSSNGRIVLSGIISGSGLSIEKLGGGRVELTGQSTFSGGVKITTGTITINSATGTLASGPLGTGIVTMQGGQLITSSLTTGTNALANDFSLVAASNQVTTNSTTTLSGIISGTGSFAKSGSGTIVLSGANIYSGKTTIGSGFIRAASLNSVGVGGSSSLGAPMNAADATLSLGATTDVGGLIYTGGSGETTDRVIDLVGTTGGGIIDQSGGGLLKFTSGMAATGVGAKTLTFQGSTAGIGEFAGAIINGASGATSVAKSGAGLWVLSGANTYTGTTTVSAGVLGFANRASLYNANTGSWTATNLIVSSGGSAAFAVGGAGEFDATDIQALSALGATTTNGFADNSTIVLDTTNAAVGIFTYSNLISNPNGGSNKLGFAKSGTNTLVLTAANTYTGNTSITAGTLQIGGVDVIPNGVGKGDVAITGGTLDLNGSNETINGLTGTGTITNSSAVAVVLTFGDNNVTTSFGGTIQDGTGPVSIVKIGTGRITLSSANSTFTGGITISEGELHAGGISSTPTIGAVTSGPLGTGTITINGGAGSPTFIPNSSGTNTLANNFIVNPTIGSGTNSINVGGVATLTGNITGAGGLRKGSGGTLNLSGANSYAGPTTIFGGTLKFLTRTSFYNDTLVNWTDTNLVVESGVTAAFAVGGPGEFTLPEFMNFATFGTAITGFKDNANIGIDTTNGGDQTISTVFTNTNAGANRLGLQKSGTNTLFLTQANTHSGTTTVVGGTLNLQNELALQNSTFATTATGAIVFDSSVVTNAFTLGGLSGSGSLNLFNNATAPITLRIGNNNNSNTYSGALGSLTGSILEKIGTGSQTLSGNNAHDQTHLSAGTLIINHASALGFGLVTIEAGTALDTNVGATIVNANNNAQLWKGDFTYTGSGRLTLGTGAVTLGANVALNTASLISGNNNSLSVGGIISDGGLGYSLTKNGGGRLFLTGQSTFSGGLNINGGTVNVSAQSSNLGSGPLGVGTVTISGAQLIGSSTVENNTLDNNIVLNGLAATNTITATGAMTLTGVISGPGGFSRSGNVGSNIILTNANTYSGETITNATSFTLANELAVQNSTIGGTGGVIFDDLVVSNAFTFGGLTGSGNLALQNDAAVAIALTVGKNNSSSTAHTGAISGPGSFVKIGTGTTSLAGNNTYAGTTTINGGTLQFGKQTSLYNNTPASWTDTNIVVESGAALGLNVGETGEFTSSNVAAINALGTATGGFKNGSSLVLDTTNATGGTFTHASPITNTNSGTNGVGLVKTGVGTLQLDAANTYTGNTTVSGGILNVATTGSITSPTGNLSVGDGAFVLGGTASVQNTVNSAGTGTIHVQSTGSLTANNLLADFATIDGVATVRANGGVAGASKVETFNISTAGKLDLKDNDLVVGSAANVTAVRDAIKLGKTNNAPSGITSDAALFGSKTGFGYAMGDDPNLSPLLTNSSLLTGQSFDTDSVLVKYTFLGDADLDGDTDLNDLGKWASNFTGDLNNPAVPAKFWTQGDFDYDGDTDLNDLGKWSSNFTGDLNGGAGSLIVYAPGASASAVAVLNGMGITVVPEPSTFVLAGVGLAGLAMAARRRKK